MRTIVSIRKSGLLLVLLCVLVICAVACKATIEQANPFEVKVDVNVRVDVYQHATDVLDYISGDTEELPEVEDATESGPASMLDTVIDLAFGVTPAYANDMDNQARYKELAQAMKKRTGEIIQYKKDKSVGENHLALLSVRENSKLKNDAEYAKKVKAAVKAENRDRQEFYKLDAKLHNQKLGQTVAAFAKARQDREPAGNWIEVKQDGKWVWKKK